MLSPRHPCDPMPCPELTLVRVRSVPRGRICVYSGIGCEHVWTCRNPSLVWPQSRPSLTRLSPKWRSRIRSRTPSWCSWTSSESNPINWQDRLPTCDTARRGRKGPLAGRAQTGCSCFLANNSGAAVNLSPMGALLRIVPSRMHYFAA